MSQGTTLMSEVTYFFIEMLWKNGLQLVGYW